MGFPESLVHHRCLSVLFKPVFSRSKANRNITRKNNRKFLPWHVIGPPCLHHILRILKSFDRFPAILAIGIPLPFHQELSPTVSLPVIKNTLNLPLLLVINEDRSWLGMGTSREPFIIVRVVGLHH